MENRESLNDIFNKLQESGKHFEAKVPDHLFGRIESRLETVKKPKKIDFQSLAAYAAISLSIAVSILILGLHLKDRSKSLPIEDHYVVQMLDMEDNKSAYPSYDIHKLMSAYETILAGETILKESSSGLDISVNN
jgi:hypothetical protein